MIDMNTNFDDLPRDGTPVLVFSKEEYYPRSFCDELRWGETYDPPHDNYWFSICFTQNTYSDEELKKRFIGFIIHPMKDEILAEDYNGEVPHK